MISTWSTPTSHCPQDEARKLAVHSFDDSLPLCMQPEPASPGP
jgi:hypothetical protein